MRNLKQTIRTVFNKLNPNYCRWCSDIPIKDYPTANDGKSIQLLSGEWVSKSSLHYIAPERLLCPHQLKRKHRGLYNQKITIKPRR